MEITRWLNNQGRRKIRRVGRIKRHKNWQSSEDMLEHSPIYEKDEENHGNEWWFAWHSVISLMCIRMLKFLICFLFSKKFQFNNFPCCTLDSQ